MLTSPPYPEADDGSWNQRGRWPAEWIGVEGEAPFVAAYRLHVKFEESKPVRVHVSADERYELFLNGERVGQGSERGDVDHWPFETYDLPVRAGDNTVVARVWSLGKGAAYAQMSLGHGFLLSPDEGSLTKELATGQAPWEGKVLSGYTFKGPQQAWGTGLNINIEGAQYPWGIENGVGQFAPAQNLGVARFASGASDSVPLRLMVPALLPPMANERWPKGQVRHVADAESEVTHDVPVRAKESIPAGVDAWQGLLGLSALTVPAHTRR